jgi:hypothetical protein
MSLPKCLTSPNPGYVTLFLQSVEEAIEVYFYKTIKSVGHYQNRVYDRSVVDESDMLPLK